MADNSKMLFVYLFNNASVSCKCFHPILMNRPKKNLKDFILEAEQRMLDEHLKKMFGYWALQFDSCVGHLSFEQSPIRHKIYFNFKTHCKIYDSVVFGDVSALPFLIESIDLMVMPHFLETVDDIDIVLNEVHRVLVPEGFLIVIGLNPFSFLGVSTGCKLTKLFDSEVKIRSIGKISSCLKKSGLDLVDIKTTFFKLPVTDAILLKKMSFMEMIGQMLLPISGGIYMIVAQKKVVTLTPVKKYILDTKLGAIERLQSNAIR